jgi:hypothetical protein
LDEALFIDLKFSCEPPEVVNRFALVTACDNEHDPRQSPDSELFYIRCDSWISASPESLHHPFISANATGRSEPIS